MLSDDVKLQIKRAIDIVDLIESYLPLQKAGTSFKARCPFHEEKTPSFHVRPVEQMFKCFGCGKGGDVFTFVMEMEKATFPEALRILAEKANIPLRPPDPAERAAASYREEIYKVNRWAAALFHKKLLEGEEGAEARAYVEKRGISPAMVSRFFLGYAPRSWEWILDQGKVKGYDADLLTAAGLALARTDGRAGHYGRFRNRLMFPIVDIRDRVAGFGARALDPADQPKYLNSPETPVFKKKEFLYGLNFARQAASKEGRLAIVEGYTDVIAAHQYGYEWVVATLGTALASEHVKQLKRFAPKVIAVYDGDAAGTKASERSLDFFLNEDVEFRIATLPAGLDPADCFVQLGKEPFEKAAAGARELFEFRLDLARGRHDTATAKGSAAAVDEIISTLALVENDVLREAQIRRVTEVFRVPETAIRKELAKKPGKTARQAEPPRAAPPAEDRDVRAGRELIELMLLGGATLEAVKSSIAIEEFPTEESRKLGELILGIVQQTGSAGPDGLFSAVAHDPARSALVADLVEEGRRKQGNPQNRLEAVVAYIKGGAEREKAARLGREGAEARARGDGEGERRAFEELARLQRDRSERERARRSR
ncbi:MAG: hypothetical protein FD180_4092 [Planctomycetota bacterium]|nr:MAG: hypothetical protein FD180_4092 [Planctomycetota bacterium]